MSFYKYIAVHINSECNNKKLVAKHIDKKTPSHSSSEYCHGVPTKEKDTNIQ